MDARRTDILERPSFSKRQKWRIGLQVAVAAVSAFAIAGMLNYLAHRHSERFYLSGSAAAKLSPFTLEVLATLTNRVKVVVFFDRREPLFGAVSSLIKEYEGRSPRIEVEFVDYRMPGRAEAVRNQYKIPAGGDTGRVIFEADGQVRTVLSTELSEFKVDTEKQQIQRVGFKGEQLFTAAILNITRTKPVNAYFLAGHGEHDPASEDDQQGYSRFARMLENNNIRVGKVEHLATQQIPQDCGLLIIAGPLRPFEQREIEKIGSYLEQGGRLLLMFNYSAVATATGLEEMLRKWGVEVGFNWVQDEGQTEAGSTGVMLTGNFGGHPIVRPLMRSSLKLIAPRSVAQRQEGAGGPNAPKVVEAVYSSPEAQALVPLGGNEWRAQGKGTIPVIAALERGGIQGVRAEGGSVRAVICGDSLFLANVAFEHAANADFDSLAVNWLVNRDTLLNEISPRPISEYQILLTEREMKRLRLWFVGLIPGGVLALGVGVWLRRRS